MSPGARWLQKSIIQINGSPLPSGRASALEIESLEGGREKEGDAVMARTGVALLLSRIFALREAGSASQTAGREGGRIRHPPQATCLIYSIEFPGKYFSRRLLRACGFPISEALVLYWAQFREAADS